MTYSETTDLFTSIMNFYLYVDQPFTHEAEQEIIDSYDPKRNTCLCGTGWTCPLLPESL
ncbi:MAG: hypothetical protein ACLSHU_02795 [Oscillospiraceae bacterium]